MVIEKSRGEVKVEGRRSEERRVEEGRGDERRRREETKKTG